MRAFAPAGVFLLAACATVPVNEGQVLAGRWGGEQVELAFDENGHGRITLPCAAASLDGPIRTQVGGHFLKPGTYTQGSGAPPPMPPTPVPANVSGRLDSDGTLWISVATADGMKLDNATLRRDREPVIHFCP